mmetsp:Transcript_21638/g.34633  ORF Transcript_21638/g.34633 Transcript_21638/m.34633 type:complete len:226 (-) Transcript_21638:265-942(-)
MQHISLSSSSELVDLLCRIAHVGQHTGQLLLVTWSAEHVVHRRRAAYHDEGLVRGWCRMRCEHLLCDEAGLSLPIGVVLGVGEHVHNLEATARILSPGFQKLFAQNILLGLVAEKHGDLRRVALSSKDGVQRLNHGRDAGATHKHRDGLLAERMLNLHVWGNVLEINVFANRKVLHMLRHLSTRVHLHGKLELPDEGIGGHWSIWPHDRIRTAFLVEFAQDAGAG